MQKQEIQAQAYRRMSKIEEMFLDHVPVSVGNYWRLCLLIAEGLSNYIASYGLLPIHVGDANDGRHEIGEGPLSQFERDTIQILDEHIEQAEIKYDQQRSVPALINFSQKPSF